MKHLGNFVALLILAVNALFTGLLLFTAYSPHIQPVTHPVQSCLGLTFPVFLMINAGFLIFWLVIQRYRSALLPLIGMLLCYSQIRTYLPINFHTDHLPETSIKLLSYNIMGFDGAAKQDGKNPILTYLKESGADILCLQEYSTVQSSKHLSQKDVERELKAYPYHRINTVGSGKGHTNKIACYSKFPILSSRILDYPSEYNGSVLYEIKIGEDTVTLINNHLESNKLTKADKVVYEDMLKSPEKEKVKSGARLLIRKLAEASAIRVKIYEIRVGAFVRRHVVKHQLQILKGIENVKVFVAGADYRSFGRIVQRFQIAVYRFHKAFAVEPAGAFQPLGKQHLHFFRRRQFERINV